MILPVWGAIVATIVVGVKLSMLHVVKELKSFLKTVKFRKQKLVKLGCKFKYHETILLLNLNFILLY